MAWFGRAWLGLAGAMRHGTAVPGWARREWQTIVNQETKGLTGHRGPQPWVIVPKSSKSLSRPLPSRWGRDGGKEAHMTSTEGLIIFQLSMCLFLSCGIGIAIGWTWAKRHEPGEEVRDDAV